MAWAWPEIVWLQPWCEECSNHSRGDWQWCDEDIFDPCEECGATSKKYVLAEDTPKPLEN